MHTGCDGFAQTHPNVSKIANIGYFVSHVLSLYVFKYSLDIDFKKVELYFLY